LILLRSDTAEKQYELICVIVDFGLGSKALSVAKKAGVTGGTIMLGRGTAQNKWLRLLELTDIRKEVVLMVCEESVGRSALDEIDRVVHFSRPKHGVAFTMPVGAFIGAGSYDYQFNVENRGEDGVYRAVFVVVDKGKGEIVMDAAREAGARGGTIVNARGSGIHETSTFLNMEIEPEKEIVLMLTPAEQTGGIVQAVRQELKIDQPGNGIIFVQDVSETYGIVS
jgi:nitrogen regulatory protein PII